MAVSHMLDSLERGGFIVREADANNRRADAVQLTEKGRKANVAWETYCHTIEQKMLRGLTQQEQFTA